MIYTLKKIQNSLKNFKTLSILKLKITSYYLTQIQCHYVVTFGNGCSLSEAMICNVCSVTGWSQSHSILKQSSILTNRHNDSCHLARRILRL